jgi:hypothetical protein
LQRKIAIEGHRKVQLVTMPLCDAKRKIKKEKKKKEKKKKNKKMK